MKNKFLMIAFVILLAAFVVLPSTSLAVSATDDIQNVDYYADFNSSNLPTDYGVETSNTGTTGAAWAAGALTVTILILVAMVVSILLLIFWIFMIVDCARRHFDSETEKIVWILVIVLVGVIGAIIYYFVVKIHDKKKDKTALAKKSNGSRKK